MITVTLGNATDFPGDADLVFTNPYAPLPAQLWTKPAIISLYEHPRSRRKLYEEKYAPGSVLWELSTWGEHQRNTMYVSRLPVVEMRLQAFKEDITDAPLNTGWFPLPMALKLLSLYAKPGAVVWDGFCGRGTVGKACQILGLSYIGIDNDPAMVARAKRYLSLE